VEEIVLIAREWKTRALITAQLSEEGYEVMALRTVEEAVVLLDRGMVRPRLIVLDTIGQSLKEAILADLQALTDDVPILVCTGPFDLTQFDFEGAGFTDLLIRPFAVGDVVDAVREILGNEATRNTSERRCQTC
jgi:DNA-binding response OmpR family regulator